MARAARASVEAVVSEASAPSAVGTMRPMATLDTWTRDLHESDDGTTRPIYTKGSGPGVIVIHQLPGITPDVVAFGDEVVAAGFTVVMPVLFGNPGTPFCATSESRCASSPGSASR